MIFIATLAAILISSSAAESALKTYNFEAKVPKEQLEGDVEQHMKTKMKQMGYFVEGGDRVLYPFHVTKINKTTQTFFYTVTWSQLYLDDRYGDPVDVGRLAIDVHGYMIYFGFTPIRLRIHAAPAPPVALKARDVGIHSFTVSWEHPKYFDVDFYKMEISNDTNNASWHYIKTINSSKTSVKLENLEKEKEYQIRMDSTNKYGAGELKSKILKVKTKGDEQEKSTSIIVVIIVVVAGILLILIIIIGVLHRCRRKENPYEYSLPGITPINIYYRDNRTFCPVVIDKDKPSDDEYFSWNEIPRTSLSTGDVLGEGEFGLVVKAILKKDNSDDDLTVAVKKVKDVATDDDRKELFKELRLMADLHEHPNVVNLIGACSHAGPLWVIVEFCKNGNLLKYLKKNRKELHENDLPFVSSLDYLTRLKFAHDVSKGMNYLEHKKVIHRDLAARNVLLDEDNVAKVSDFGLSRDIYEVGLYQKTTAGKLPVKWMAIESLQEATYTSKSDVWSFAVLFWEIESAGMLPYPGISGLDLVPHLQRGYRLPKPFVTTSDIYALMKTCWELDPQARPNFKVLEEKLCSCMNKSDDVELGDSGATYENHNVDEKTSLTN